MSFLSLEVSLLNEIQQRRSEKACFLLWSFPQKRLTSKCRQSWAHPAEELSVSLLRAFKSLSGILLWRFIPFLVSNLIIAFLLNCLWAVWPLKSGSLLARLGMVIPHWCLTTAKAVVELVVSINRQVSGGEECPSSCVLQHRLENLKITLNFTPEKQRWYGLKVQKHRYRTAVSRLFSLPCCIPFETFYSSSSSSLHVLQTKRY